MLETLFLEVVKLYSKVLLEHKHILGYFVNYKPSHPILD